MKTVNFGRNIFCLKEIGLPKTVDFGGNYFKTRQFSCQRKVLLKFCGGFLSERESLQSLRGQPALVQKVLEAFQTYRLWKMSWKNTLSVSAEKRMRLPKSGGDKKTS